MTAYIESAKQVGRLENAIGWYHSHPGTVQLQSYSTVQYSTVQKEFKGEKGRKEEK